MRVPVWRDIALANNLPAAAAPGMKYAGHPAPCCHVSARAEAEEKEDEHLDGTLLETTSGQIDCRNEPGIDL